MKLFGKELTPLLKSEAGEQLPQDQVDVVGAFNASMAELGKSVEATGEGNGVEVTPEPDNSQPAGDVVEPTPAVTPAVEPVEKSQANASLESILQEGNEETKKTIDASPFLKSLVDGIDQKINAAIKGVSQQIETMSKSLTSMAGVQASLAKAIVAEGQLMKSMMEIDDDSLNRPVDIKSAQTTERFAKSVEGQDTNISMLQARAHLTKLAKSQYDSVKINIWEKGLNKGVIHPEFLVEMQTAMTAIKPV